MREFYRNSLNRIMTIALAATLGVASVVLTACGGDTNEPGDVKAPRGQVVRIVNVEGVRCAIISGRRSSGIDCDWSGK